MLTAPTRSLESENQTLPLPTFTPDAFPKKHSSTSTWPCLFIMPSTKPNWVSTVLIAVPLIFLFFYVRSKIKTGPPQTPTAIQLYHIKALGNALRASALQHDGKYPASLSDLPLDSLPAVVHQYHDPVTDAAGDWIYYPGHTMTDAPDLVLVAAPTPMVNGSQRLVLFIDISTKIIPEPEYQADLARAKK